jgi:hypothetical protein
MTEKELKRLIGAATYNRMKAFALKEKKQGLAAVDVKTALRKKFGKRLKVVDSSVIINDITGMMPYHRTR